MTTYDCAAAEAFNTFKGIFQSIQDNGAIVSPRGLKCLEWEAASVSFPPGVRFMNFTARKFNLDYVKLEFLWYLRGDRYDLSIAENAKIWKSCIDERQQLNSNYGYYLFRRLPTERENPGAYHQSHLDNDNFDRTGAGDLAWVVSELSKDRDSRRASAVILAAEHMRAGVVDFPCTYALNFRIRQYSPNEKPVLNMSVHMRSQDVIYGLGNDAPCFSFIHEIVLNLLRETYPDLELGVYNHCVDSLHVYEKHFPMLEQILMAEIDEFEHIVAPPISGPAEARFLLRMPQDPGVIVQPQYKFTQWLLNK
jgi:thymidylate synthase